MASASLAGDPQASWCVVMQRPFCGHTVTGSAGQDTLEVSIGKCTHGHRQRSTGQDTLEVLVGQYRSVYTGYRKVW